MVDLAPWTRHALIGVAKSGRYGVADGPAGVAARLYTPAMALAAAYSGAASECRDRLAGYLGLGADSLAPRRAAFGPTREAFWTGLDRWLVLGPETENVEAMLSAALGSLAAVTDQSDGRFMLRLSGPRVRDALAKGLSIDLHPRVFREGDCVPVLLSHLNCAIARRQAPEVYDLIGPRAAAGDIWHWLHASAGEYGLTLEVSE